MVIYLPNAHNRDKIILQSVSWPLPKFIYLYLQHRLFHNKDSTVPAKTRTSIIIIIINFMRIEIQAKVEFWCTSNNNTVDKWKYVLDTNDKNNHRELPLRTYQV